MSRVAKEILVIAVSIAMLLAGYFILTGCNPEKKGGAVPHSASGLGLINLRRITLSNLAGTEIRVKRSDNQPGTRTLDLEHDDQAHLGKSLKTSL